MRGNGAADEPEQAVQRRGCYPARMEHDDPVYRMTTRLNRIALVVFAIAALCLGPDAEGWRFAGLGSMAGLFVVPEFLRLSRREPPWWLLGPMVLIAPMVCAGVTGGVQSPFLVAYVPIAVITGYVLGKGSLPVVLGAALVIWGFLSLHVWWRPAGMIPAMLGAPLPTSGAVFWATAVTTFVIAGNRMARHVRDQLHAEQARLLGVRRSATEAMARGKADLVALSGAIAHELKNPLTAVLSLLSFRHGQAADGGDEREQLGVALAQLDRMRARLETLLDLARPADALTREVVALGPVIDEVLDAHGAMAAELGVRFAARRGDARAPVDRRKLSQVVANLVQNALQACADGGRVEVALSATADDAIVEVFDDGQGLPDGSVERLFRPGVTHRAGGYGIGLTVCRTIVEQHGGRLELARRDGGGSVARLSLPRVMQSAPPAEQAVEED